MQANHTDAPARLSLGATFGMDMKIGAPYKITNTVVEFEEGRRLAWRHFNGHIWRYIFEPVGDGSTKVTEQWDARPVWNRLLLRITFAKRNRDGIKKTLQRLDHIATQPA